MRNIYKDAIFVQDASNIRGVVNSLYELLDHLVKDGIRDSDSLRRHPTVKMYAAKLIEMTEMGLAEDEAYSDAYQVCRERSGGFEEAGESYT